MLLIPFALLGIAILVILILFDVTIAVGTLSGIVLPIQSAYHTGGGICVETDYLES